MDFLKISILKIEVHLIKWKKNGNIMSQIDFTVNVQGQKLS